MSKLSVGPAQGGIDQPTHVKGIAQGNSCGNYEKMRGHKADGTSDRWRSTGVASTEPVDPTMPNLSPA